MPNWELNDQVRKFLRYRVNHLADRTRDYAQADFPLDQETLQMLVMDREQVMTMRDLAFKGVSLPAYNQQRLGFLREQLPGLLRGVTVMLETPKNMYMALPPESYARDIRLTTNSRQFAHLDFEREPLPDEKREALVSWLNRAVRQKRLAEITQFAAAFVLEKHAKTCAHLHRIWPTLATLINSVDGTLTHRSRTGDRLWHDTWKDRLHARHRPLAMYDPDPKVMEELRPLMKAADTVLTAGMMLAPYETEPGTVRAVVDYWEALPTDKRYP
jgi:hypothetical protein